MSEKPTYNRRSVFAWCLYDFGNSAFTTLVVTFIYATFFTKVIAADEITGTALWSRGVTITALAVAALSPVLGALADRGGFRKLFLFLTTVVCVAGSLLLYTALPGQTTKALVIFVIANVAFEMGCVFYNAFLPDVASADRIGRISGYGWALGYVGGLLAMAVAMVGFVSPDVPWFGLAKDAGQHIRATNILVAVWFAIFSLPMFLWVKEDRSRVDPDKSRLVSSSLRQLVGTFHEMKRYRQIVRLLVARLIYNDGLVTIFAFGGIYAVGTFGFSFEDIMIFGIVLNITAGLGAFLLGFLDDILGGKRTIQISLIGLLIATVIALLAPDRTWFWVAGILIGIFSGPNQAASRSLMGRFTPPEKENEFFGFFAFSGKATAFAGPFILGILTQAFESQRAGVSIVALFFVVGSVLLLRVDEREGIERAGRISPGKDETLP